VTQPSGLFARGSFDYVYNSYNGALDSSQRLPSLSLISGCAELGYTYSFGPRFRLVGFGGAGYSYGFKNESISDSGQSLYAEGGVGVDLLLSPALGLTLGASFRDYFGLTMSVNAYLGTTIFLSGVQARQAQIKSAQPIDVELIKGFKVAPPGKGLSIEKIDFASVFPVFRKYYDDHPIGAISVRNNEKTAISDVTVSLFVKEFMESPKVTSFGSVESGATVSIPILALFSEKVLETTEATKTAAEISVEYRMAETPYRAEKVESLRVLDRNAMTWDDDRRVVAFVTAKDPAVLTFAKNVEGVIRDARTRGVNERLQDAMALHEALALYGLAYVIDPKSAYSDKAKDNSQADFLQFPRQTLQYRGGDCDDLSILNCALLEAIGVETAFITVPGHIYMAFSLGIKPDEAKRAFSSADDLILLGDRAWVPVEITNIQKGFIAAWKEGAREWRESSSKGEAKLYPTREAWSVYEPVGLPGSGAEIVMPSQGRILESFKKDSSEFIDAELAQQASALEAALKKQEDKVKRNQLGLLYARYDKLDIAAAEFKKANAPKDYLPALINLGNVSFLGKKWKDAKAYYERAYKLDQNNARVLLGIARSAFELEDSEAAAEYYRRVTAADPVLSAQYSYLGKSGPSATREANIAGLRETVPWE
jgi:tetratricopeptide (TPR) repeat protein